MGIGEGTLSLGVGALPISVFPGLLPSVLTLAGFLRCGTCGGNLVATARSGRGGVKKYWICTTAHTRGREACANVKGIPYEVLADAVVTEFKQNFLNPVALGQLLMRELEARTAAPQAAKEEAESLQSVGNISTLHRREPRRGLPRADISTHCQTPTSAVAAAPARPVSESGTLRRGDGTHGRSDRCRRAFVLPILRFASEKDVHLGDLPILGGEIRVSRK